MIRVSLSNQKHVSSHTKAILIIKNYYESCISYTQTDGSLSLCQPSENLRKLVPEEVFNFNAAMQSYSKLASALLPSNTENLDAKNENEIDENISSLDGDNQEEFVVISKISDARNNTAVDITLATAQEIAKRNAAALIDMSSLLSRPTLLFCLQNHNLEKLRYAMKRNLRIATCRIYALQALNWFIRSVTQTTCLHDLMWWFVSSLNPATEDEMSKFEEQALEHPMTSIKMCDKISSLLNQNFHSFLQSVADLTLLLPSGSALQQLAIQCFGIKFHQMDHHFLHQSHVFGNISKILSRSDELREQQTDDLPLILGDHSTASGTKFYSLVDMSGMFEVNVSSRQAMALALTDNSTETFWESDEEDRNKSKMIEISLNKFDFVCKMIAIHTDNTRDIQNKVMNVLFYGGQSLGDTTLMKSFDVNSKTGSWISTNVTDESFIHFRIELKGAETLRVRQIKLLGIPISSDEAIPKGNTKLLNASQIQHRNCESETLRVFRLLTAQVFGKLILGNENDGELDDTNNEDGNSTHLRSIGTNGALESNTTSMLADSLDLREHMVGILFSRSKLSHLQKQVIVHIVHAIRKETVRAKDEWEAANTAIIFENRENNAELPLACSEHKSESTSENSRAPDIYCFEMLSMVLALSGSTVGRSYLSNQHGLLNDLLTLLHTGSDRVQRQVTALLRRILPEISPEQFAEMLNIHCLPPNDFNITSQSSEGFDMNRLGLLDIFLAIIAKSLQLQVKIKSTNALNAIGNKQPIALQLCNCIDLGISNLIAQKSARMSRVLSDQANESHEVVPKKIEPQNLNQRWFLKGSINIKQAENIISLIRDMAGVSFNIK